MTSTKLETRNPKQMELSRSGNQGTSGQDTGTSGYQDSRASGYQGQTAGFESLWVWDKAHKLMLEAHQICKPFLVKKSSEYETSWKDLHLPSPIISPKDIQVIITRTRLRVSMSRARKRGKRKIT